MPLFALCNAAVPVTVAQVGSPVSLAVMLGLIVGKPVGIVLFCWLSIRLGLAKLPHDTSWTMVVGGACLAGIGFTMALFISDQALSGELLLEAKTGVLVGSAIAAVLGFGLLLYAARGASGTRGG